jgi:gamma-glutamyltranspeptidase/glutathione hydrolase
MNEATFTRPLLRVGSAVAGGQLTPADFAHTRDVDHQARVRSEEGLWLEAPWASDPKASDSGAELGDGAAVCAVDVHGLFAALAYRRVREGVLVEELELLCPLAAVPTRRGVTRVAPGSSLFTPAPLAIVCDAVRGPISVIAAPNAIRLSAESDASLSIERNPATRLVEAVKR